MTRVHTYTSSSLRNAAIIFLSTEKIYALTQSAITICAPYGLKSDTRARARSAGNLNFRHRFSARRAPIIEFSVIFRRCIREKVRYWFYMCDRYIYMYEKAKRIRRKSSGGSSLHFNQRARPLYKRCGKNNGSIHARIYTTRIYIVYI